MLGMGLPRPHSGGDAEEPVSICREDRQSGRTLVPLSTLRPLLAIALPTLGSLDADVTLPALSALRTLFADHALPALGALGSLFADVPLPTLSPLFADISLRTLWALLADVTLRTLGALDSLLTDVPLPTLRPLGSLLANISLRSLWTLDSLLADISLPALITLSPLGTLNSLNSNVALPTLESLRSLCALAADVALPTLSTLDANLTLPTLGTLTALDSLMALKPIPRKFRDRDKAARIERGHSVGHPLFSARDGIHQFVREDQLLRSQSEFLDKNACPLEPIEEEFLVTFRTGRVGFQLLQYKDDAAVTVESNRVHDNLPNFPSLARHSRSNTAR